VDAASARRSPPGEQGRTSPPGLSVLLLYYRREMCYPENRHEVPRPVVAHVAVLVGMQSAEWLQHDWTNGAVARLRTLFPDWRGSGLSRSHREDADDLATRLVKHVVAGEKATGW